MTPALARRVAREHKDPKVRAKAEAWLAAHPEPGAAGMPEGIDLQVTPSKAPPPQLEPEPESILSGISPSLEDQERAAKASPPGEEPAASTDPDPVGIAQKFKNIFLGAARGLADEARRTFTLQETAGPLQEDLKSIGAGRVPRAIAGGLATAASAFDKAAMGIPTAALSRLPGGDNIAEYIHGSDPVPLASTIGAGLLQGQGVANVLTKASPGLAAAGRAAATGHPMATAAGTVSPVGGALKREAAELLAGSVLGGAGGAARSAIEGGDVLGESGDDFLASMALGVPMGALRLGGAAAARSIRGQHGIGPAVNVLESSGGRPATFSAGGVKTPKVYDELEAEAIRAGASPVHLAAKRATPAVLERAQAADAAGVDPVALEGRIARMKESSDPRVLARIEYEREAEAARLANEAGGEAAAAARKAADERAAARKSRLESAAKVLAPQLVDSATAAREAAIKSAGEASAKYAGSPQGQASMVHPGALDELKAIYQRLMPDGSPIAMAEDMLPEVVRGIRTFSGGPDASDVGVPGAIPADEALAARLLTQQEGVELGLLDPTKKSPLPGAAVVFRPKPARFEDLRATRQLIADKIDDAPRRSGSGSATEFWTRLDRVTREALSKYEPNEVTGGKPVSDWVNDMAKRFRASEEAARAVSKDVFASETARRVNVANVTDRLAGMGGAGADLRLEVLRDLANERPELAGALAEYESALSESRIQEPPVDRAARSGPIHARRVPLRTDAEALRDVLARSPATAADYQSDLDLRATLKKVGYERGMPAGRKAAEYSVAGEMEKAGIPAGVAQGQYYDALREIGVLPGTLDEVNLAKVVARLRSGKPDDTQAAAGFANYGVTPQVAEWLRLRMDPAMKYTAGKPVGATAGAIGAAGRSNDQRKNEVRR